ncbi:MAG: MASE3 domain-containing protein [Candidatus Paceibacterota bacterium]|jgi:PAS domain S-box-containing protein
MLLSIREQVLLQARAIPADIYRYTAVGALALAVLYLVGLDNRLSLHNLTELSGIVLMVLIFVITLNARDYLNNEYVLFIGISVIATAFTSLLHLLSYGGMNVSSESTETNVATQLWVATQYLQASAFVAAPFFIGKRIKVDMVLLAYAIATFLLLFSIFYWNAFPVSYIEGVGQTAFTRASGITVSLALLLSLLLLIWRRPAFEKKIFYLLCSSVATGIASAAFFVWYAGANDLSNLIGNSLGVVSFYFFYQAVATISFKDPYKQLLQSVKEKEEDLQEALEDSEMHESETASLSRSAQEALKHTEFKDSAEAIADACKKTIGAESCYAVLQGREDEQAEIVYCDSLLQKCVADVTQSAPMKSAMKKMCRTGKTVLDNDFFFTLENQGANPFRNRIVIQSALLVPILLNGLPAGFFAFVSKPGGFTEDDKRIASAFGHMASLALQNQRALSELKENEQKFRSVADSIRNALITFDSAGRVVYWNKSAKRIFGYDEKEVLGKPFVLGVENQAAGKDAPLAKESGPLEMRGLRKNGEEFPMEVSSSSWKFGRERFYTSIVRDISKQKESEHQVQEYADRMAEGKARDDALLLSIADGILVTDMSGKIIYINSALEKLCGMDAKEILHRDLDESIPFFDDRGQRVPKEKRPIYLALDPEVQKTLPISTATTFHLVNKKDRRKVPLSISAAPFVVDGEVMGAVVAWRDITHEREVDKAKNEFISFASHQLRTPLTSISLSIDMLLHHVNDLLTREQKKYLKIAFKGIKDMTDIIETLLNISRIQMGTLVINLEPVNLTKFSDKMLEDVGIALKEKEIRVKKLYEDIPDIEIDRRLMEIILENLISNAIKYSPDRGTLLIEIKKKGRDALIAVSDTGNGIPKDQQKKIFEKLFRVQTDDKVKGTGLGLYIAKAAVDQYHGRIWCESPSPRAFGASRDSAEQNGTTFYVTVPLAGMDTRHTTTP